MKVKIDVCTKIINLQLEKNIAGDNSFKPMLLKVSLMAYYHLSKGYHSMVVTSSILLSMSLK